MFDLCAAHAGDKNVEVVIFDSKVRSVDGLTRFRRKRNISRAVCEQGERSPYKDSGSSVARWESASGSSLLYHSLFTNSVIVITRHFLL